MSNPLPRHIASNLSARLLALGRSWDAGYGPLALLAALRVSCTIWESFCSASHSLAAGGASASWCQHATCHRYRDRARRRIKQDATELTHNPLVADSSPAAPTIINPQ